MQERPLRVTCLHPLGGICGGIGPLHGNALDGLPRQLAIMAIRAVHGETDGYATAVRPDAVLGTDRAAVGRMLPHLFPPKGRFGHRVVHREPWSIPRKASYATSPCSPKATKTS